MGERWDNLSKGENTADGKLGMGDKSNQWRDCQKKDTNFSALDSECVKFC